MSRKMKTFGWEEDGYTKQWLDGVKERSKKVYKYEFNSWMQFIKISPTKQIEKRIKDLQSDNPKIRNYFEDKLVEYKNRLEVQGYTSKTLSNKLTPVRAFFTTHRVQLHFRRGELKGKSSEKDKIIKKFVPKNEELRAMYDLAPVRDRALLLVLYQSGFSPVDALGLNIEEIDKLYELEDEHYYISMHRSKTNSVVATCISNEAIHEIQSMLKDRGKPTEGALFVTPRGERLTTRFLNIAMKRLAQKALSKERGKQFITKSLRDSYNVALLRGNLSQEIKDLMFGHRRSGAKSSYAYDEIVIKQAYMKVFKYLSINGGKQTKKAIAKLEEKFDTSIQTLSEMITKQQEQIKARNEKIVELEDQVIMFTEALLERDKEITDLKYQLENAQEATNKQFGLLNTKFATIEKALKKKGILEDEED